MSQGKQRSVVRIAVDGIVGAPRRAKLALAANMVLLLGIVAITLMDEPDSSYVAKAVATGLTMIGAMILNVATVLWALSQRGGECSFFDLKRQSFRMHARRLDETLVPFVMLVFVAGWMMAVGLAIFVVRTQSWAVRGLMLFMGAWFFTWTSGMIAATVRFLYTHAREQAAAAERARTEATESQLAALQAQMNPHFLFNALNTVASLVRTDAVAAEATVENLAVVLRRTMDRSSRILSPVDEEIDHLAAYLSVAKQRFEDRLEVNWAVDPEARDVLLPTMTLQPLVENALKHGLGARMEGGGLHIGVHLEGAKGARAGAATGERSAGADDGDASSAAAFAETQRLVVEVADDGPGFARRHREGTGLTNLRARLSTLYGDAADLRIERGGPGARVIVSVPAIRSDDEVLAAASGAAASAPAPTPVGAE